MYWHMHPKIPCVLSTGQNKDSDFVEPDVAQPVWTFMVEKYSLQSTNVILYYVKI